jgi:hypothetical protein
MLASFSLIPLSQSVDEAQRRALGHHRPRGAFAGSIINSR